MKEKSAGRIVGLGAVICGIVLLFQIFFLAVVLTNYDTIVIPGSIFHKVSAEYMTWYWDVWLPAHPGPNWNVEQLVLLLRWAFYALFAVCLWSLAEVEGFREYRKQYGIPILLAGLGVYLAIFLYNRCAAVHYRLFMHLSACEVVSWTMLAVVLSFDRFLRKRGNSLFWIPV